MSIGSGDKGDFNGFIHRNNYLPGDEDAFVQGQLIRKLGLRRGDYIKGLAIAPRGKEKYAPLKKILSVNGIEMTEDMDFSIGRIVMGEGRSMYRNVGFVDAHNSVRKVGNITYPSTKEGNEYIKAGVDAMVSMSTESMYPFSVGACQVKLPFTKKDGFGETGMVIMVVEVDSTKTAYILFDGNNVYPGVRETLRDAVLSLGYDECEILTTDSHVVNEKSGMNPVGMAIPSDKIIPFIIDGLKEAENDLLQAEVGASTGLCEDVAVFGPGKITQLVALVSGISSSLLPYTILIVLVAFFMVLTMCLLVL